jgi:hypothetical protein
MAHGFMYLVVIMDWYSRYVLAWRISNSLDAYFGVKKPPFRSKPAGLSDQIGHHLKKRRWTTYWHRITLEVIHAEQEVVLAQDQRDSTVKIRMWD